MENKSCDSCDYCDSCNYCNYCDSCDYCNSCNSCDSCINLKMTEYNYFCYYDKNEDWFQIPRYQIFNKQFTKEEYNNIEKIYIKLEFDKNEYYKTRYKTAFNKAFQKLSEEDKNKIISLPWFNSEDFKKYYWVDIKVKEYTIKQLEEKLWEKLKIIK